MVPERMRGRLAPAPTGIFAAKTTTAVGITTPMLIRGPGQPEEFSAITQPAGHLCHLCPAADHRRRPTSGDDQL